MSDDETDEPLADVRRRIDERRDHDDDDGGADVAALFEEMSVAEIDEDAVWTALATDADSAAAAPSSAAATDSAAADDGETTVVESSLCHGCPHFAAPPEMGCTHEGTTIAAMVDVDHFRVVDCPIVARRAGDDPSDFSADHE
ncbi:hypothetical protein KVP04_08920 [Halobacterium salinarum]|uniref:hypothetical protein n=1 Tax=Halobacterium salinarum TaxID=2242 RepID=UPI001F3133EE|nr:hypothetical protein [Halobacterium salinarum]MCF2239248.1 hypothetical protein [Halobacterium salinarum]